VLGIVSKHHGVLVEQAYGETRRSGGCGEGTLCKIVKPWKVINPITFMSNACITLCNGVFIRNP
jgi:hypothetical protein